MSNVGELTISEIQRKYDLGFSYAKNIVESLVQIGYIKPKNEYIYSIIATQEQIDSYIKEHMAGLRPTEYDEFDLKNNGYRTIKRKFSDKMDFLIKVGPRFLGRLIFSIPSLVALVLLTLTLSCATTDDAGRHFYIWEILVIDFFGYCTYIFPANIVFRIFFAHHLKMKFKDYMCLPTNWYFNRIKSANRIQRILHPDKHIILLSNYDSTIKELTAILEQKKQLASHYAQIANRSCDENEFHTALNSCIDTLQWMSQFEEYGVFRSSSIPSADLETIQNELPCYQDELRNRIAEKQRLRITLSQLDIVDKMDGHSFEYYCAELLKKNGFVDVEVTRGSGDHGVDILADKDDNSYAIQCKCYTSNIGNAAVQQAYTGKDLYKKDIAVVLTNQYFTPQAKAEADRLRVKLWDRDKLRELISNATE